ncbi:hypothetical protein HF086_016793 [Spodoptera exigua]|uniref:TRAF1-6 MATH domain-containing protein n=1 Tax=Spodoptera exigua TaxID=7107 RepID=A0A922MKQ5_SPOEX|nr:hypothetical protein HF086_016793 [Spodoptera exigua]
MSLTRLGQKTDGTAEKTAKDCPCYFCNELFELGQLQTRTSSSHVSVPAPAPPPPVSNYTWSPRQVPIDDCVSYLEKEVASIKLVLTEESGHRDVQATEIENIRSKLVLVEERSQHFLSTLVSLRAAVDDEAERKMIPFPEEVINYIRQTVEEERERNAENRAALEAELMEARRSSEQLANLSALRMQLQTTSDERPGIDRVAVLEVATADARAELSEHSTKVDAVLRDLRALTKSYHKMRNELADFQSKVTFDRNELGSEDGKAEINLNGIGKWKGRHITSTVRLVAGPYDALLEWPCDLNINIILRDQPNNRAQAMDIVKSLQLKRKSSSKRHDYDDGGGDEEKTKSSETLDKSVTQLKRQYIFIPHTSLDKFEYVKNDVMFIEFIVNQ